MNEQDIPIDIHINKLSDWLISRRIVDKNWQRSIKDIRNKINSALKDMPGNKELIDLLSGSYINYFHCLQIVEILKTTEKDSKNIFGGYASQRMKDWNTILRSYEKDSLYLGEASQLATRNINYEIPSARKQMTILEKLSTEALARSQDAVKSENILRQEYVNACQQLGIKGDKIKLELVEKLKDLPALQSQVAKKIVELQKAVNLYENFSGNKRCLPVTKHLMKKGNTTVYEYRYGEAPLKIEEPSLPFKVEDEEEQNNGNEIDFGDEGSEIDFGEGEEEVKLEVGEIDWGADDDNNQMQSTDEINFDISLEGSGIVIEEQGMSGGVAKDGEAFTLLDAPQYRDLILDELFELEAFLKMRFYELQSSDKVHVISLSLLDGFTDHDAKTVNSMLAIVANCCDELSAPLIVQLHQIKHSSKYVDILTNKLRSKLRGIEKFQRNQVTLREKSEELKKQATDLKPNLAQMTEQTKTLLKNIEKDISKRYKNRIVNLMGANL